MNEELGLAEIKHLNKHLSKLLEDPHPGLWSWGFELSRTLGKLSLYCGIGIIVDAAKVAEERKWL